MLESPEIFARIYARHGHRCPMSTLGGRLGLAAMLQLGDGPGQLQASYGARTCALDGIHETTGCSEGAGTLAVATEARHVLRLERGGKACEAELTGHALELAGRYRVLCDRLEKGWNTLDEAERTVRTAQMEAALDELLPVLWHAAEQDLVKVTPV